ncbi:MAG: hypothetical protein IJI15_01340, partial [Atopobiaceae bacterium]|nr:hypothetical protein [Atopobiaceae bacterium]
MDEKSSNRSNRKLAIAVIALLAFCLIALLMWNRPSSPSEPSTDIAVQVTPVDDGGLIEPEELPVRAATGVSMSAQQTSDALEIVRSQPGGTRPANLAEGSWTIFVYLCGSDLESRSGAATKDLNEMLSGCTGSNVRFVVETGGARTWRNNA